MLRLRLPLAFSALLHLAVAATLTAGPMLMPPDVDLEDETEEGPTEGGDAASGELPIEELLNERPPFSVSIYAEPPPPPVVATQPEPVPVPEPAVMPLPVPVAELPAALPTPAPEPVAVPEPPPPEPEIVEVPVVTEAERDALAAMEQGEATPAPEADDDGSAHEAAEERAQRREARWRRHANKDAKDKKPKRPPCPEAPESIARVAETHWYIDRSLIEHYATNLVELQKLGSVWTHRGPDGKLDGFKVGLSRCSVLRQGGLKSGDIVHDINGRRIYTVLQAVGAYLALRTEPELTLNVTRRGKPVILNYTVEQPKRKAKRNAKK
jgi:hypothetical protein